MSKYISWPSIKKYLPLLLTVYLPPIILIVILGVIAKLTNIPTMDFFDDPSQIVGYDYYIGLVNNLGIIIWAATMGICIFTFFILRRTDGNGGLAKFLLFSGLLTLILLIDDFFLIHEWLYDYTSEFIVPVVFLILFILLVFRFRKIILDTDYIFLIAAIVFFGISLVLDVLQSRVVIISGGVRTLMEDGCKLLGIISWLTYFARTGLAELRSPTDVSRDT